jgi:dihydrofolate reductase
VVSTTLSDENATWDNSTVIREDVPGTVRRLKDELAGDLLVQGSSILHRTLAEARLVDRYRLMVFPILLGKGKRLFGDAAPKTKLRLVDSNPVGPDGVFANVYEPAD